MKPRSDVRLALRAGNKPGASGGVDVPVGHTYDYERLMRVTIRNTYYSGQHHCPGFTAKPTPATAQFMRDIGLIFLREPSGFSVVYDAHNRDGFLRFLQQQRKNTGGKFETRLSVVLALDEPSFGLFTVLPPRFRPDARNFFFSNENAHRTGRGIVLSRGDSPALDDLLRVVASQVPLDVARGTAAIEVMNLFGDVVAMLPIPASRRVFIDLSSLPHDEYLLREVSTTGQTRPERVLYTLPGQFAFVELLFAAPAPGSSGIYPVNFDSDRIVSRVDYEIVFERRTAQWRYYIVPPRRRTFEGLTIDTEPPGVAFFTGPVHTTLANGQPALRFESKEALPLSEMPPARFILNSDDGIVLRSMPVAPLDSLNADCSDIYVYV